MSAVPSTPRPARGRRPRAFLLGLFGHRPNTGPALRTAAVSGAKAAEAMEATAAAVQQASAGLTQSARAVGVAVLVDSQLQGSDEHRRILDAEKEVYNLTAVKEPDATFSPGTYTVTFGRMPGAVWPPDLTTTATSTTELADAITAHLRPRIADPRPLTASVDPAARGGILRLGDHTLGAFSFTVSPATEARAGTPAPEPSPGKPPFLLYPYNLPPISDLTSAQRDGEACVYCPGDITPFPGDGMKVVGRLRGVLVIGHPDCAEQHRIEP